MLYILSCIAVIALDILTKLWALTLRNVKTIPLIEGVLHLTYVENRGAAWGVLADSRWLLMAMTVAILAVILFASVRIKNKPWILSLAMSLTVGGAVGNMIDRVRLGYVIDFIDFRLIDFPVFNVADIFVCIGAGLFMLYFIFEERFTGKNTDTAVENEPEGV